jgi:hypothetical protein
MTILVEELFNKKSKINFWNINNEFKYEVQEKYAKEFLSSINSSKVQKLNEQQVFQYEQRNINGEIFYFLKSNFRDIIIIYSILKYLVGEDYKKDETLENRLKKYGTDIFSMIDFEKRDLKTSFQSGNRSSLKMAIESFPEIKEIRELEKDKEKTQSKIDGIIKKLDSSSLIQIDNEELKSLNSKKDSFIKKIREKKSRFIDIILNMQLEFHEIEMDNSVGDDENITIISKLKIRLLKFMPNQKDFINDNIKELEYLIEEIMESSHKKPINLKRKSIVHDFSEFSISLFPNQISIQGLKDDLVKLNDKDKYLQNYLNVNFYGVNVPKNEIENRIKKFFKSKNSHELILNIENFLKDIKIGNDSNKIYIFIKKLFEEFLRFSRVYKNFILKSEVSYKYFQLLLFDRSLRPLIIKLFDIGMLDKVLDHLTIIDIAIKLEESINSNKYDKVKTIFNDSRFDIYQNIENEKFLLEKLNSIILHKFKNKDNFRKHIQNSLYERNQKILKSHILFTDAIEREIDFQEIKESWNEIEVEHIFPQEPNFDRSKENTNTLDIVDYSLQYFDFQDLLEYELYNSLTGNMLLLEKKPNKEAGNKFPEEKWKPYELSKLVVNFKVRDFKSKNNIVERTEELLKPYLDMYDNL